MALLLSLACSNPEKEKARHLEQGQRYLAEGNVEAAILELRNVVKLDPLDERGRYQLAMAYLRRNDPASLGHAREHLAVAVQEDPNHLEARLRLGDLCLRLGETAQATNHSETALRLAPEDPRALLLRGRAGLAAGRFESALADLHRVAEREPGNAEVLVHLGRALMGQQKYQEALKRVERALELDPRLLAAHLTLGDLHALLGNEPKAEKAYRRALELDPGDNAALSKLTELLGRAGRWDAAEAAYKQHVAAKPQDSAAELALGSFYLERGKADLAQPHLEKSVELDPNSAVALDKLLELKLVKGDLGGLREGIRKLAEKRADHPLAQYYRARLELAQRNHDEGIRLLRDLVQRHPDVGAAHLTLGTALAATGDRPSAIQALQRATSVAPTAAKAHLALAELHLAQRSPPHLAVVEASKASELNPRDVPTALTYARALARASQIPRAASVLVAVAPTNPKDPRVPFGLGLLAREQGEHARALEHFAQALILDPKYSDALEEATAILLQDKKYQQAQELAKAQLAIVPNCLEHQIIYGKTLEAAGKTKDAEAAYQGALSMAEVASDAYARLATLYLKSKQADVAIKGYEEELAKNPKQLGPHVILGILFHVRGDTGQARRHYEAALGMSAKEAISSNNLASLLADEGKELDRARKLAEAAHRERPGDANVLDTLGWVHYRARRYPQAVSLLAAAHGMAPRNPLFAFHYGMALAELKDRRGEAKSVLTSLLGLGPRFPYTGEVKAALAKL